MTQQRSRWMLIASMCIFGTIGILRKYIPLPSSVVALARAVIGTVFLVIVILAKRQPVSKAAVRRNLLPLILSGMALGFNWILLFESYNHTSVATATLCYYLAPILVILISPLVLKETLTVRKLLCATAALAGMVLVSGITESEFQGLAELRGIGFGLGAAVLYASVVVLNKKMPDIGAYDKTITQLGISALTLIPYVLLTEDVGSFTLAPGSILLLLAAGIVHTGIAYWLYFGAIGSLKAQTAAIYSYIDPVLAIFLSLTVLQEPMSAGALIGGIMILGAAFLSER